MHERIAQAQQATWNLQVSHVEPLLRPVLNDDATPLGARAFAHEWTAHALRGLGRMNEGDWHDAAGRIAAEKLVANPQRDQSAWGQLLLLKQQLEDVGEDYLMDAIHGEADLDARLDHLLDRFATFAHEVSAFDLFEVAARTVATRAFHQHDPADATQRAVDRLPLDEEQVIQLDHFAHLLTAFHLGDEDIADAAWDDWQHAKPHPPPYTLRTLTRLFDSDMALQTAVSIPVYYEARDAFAQLREHLSPEDVDSSRLVELNMSFGAAEHVAARLAAEASVMLEAGGGDAQAASGAAQLLDLLPPFLSGVVDQVMAVVDSDLWSAIDRRYRAEMVRRFAAVLYQLDHHTDVQSELAENFSTDVRVDNPPELERLYLQFETLRDVLDDGAVRVALQRVGRG